MRKSIVGLTFIRQADIKHDYFTHNASRCGGLIEFYRSPTRVTWTHTGTNVPDHPRMARLWWPRIATAISGDKTPQAALDALAQDMDAVLADLQNTGMLLCTPRRHPKLDTARRLSRKGAPWKKREVEKPQDETIAYDRLLQAWREGRVPWCKLIFAKVR